MDIFDILLIISALIVAVALVLAVIGQRKLSQIYKERQTRSEYGDTNSDE
jgi:hypothetical protein